MTPLQREVQITNIRGLHARASAKFVTLASAHSAEVEVEKDGSKVAGTSIMGLMMLAASQGCNVTLRAKGNQADQVVAALEIRGETAPARAEDAGGVGFVDHQHRLVPVGDRG